MEPLSTTPSIVLDCGHSFCEECIRKILKTMYSGPRISFSFLKCPDDRCTSQISHPLLASDLAPSLALEDAVRKKALMRLRYEQAEKMPELSDPASKFFNDPSGFALDRYAYYLCHKCDKPYFGGLARCGVAVGTFKREDLICGGCQPQALDALCPTHGAEYVMWKCRFCCTPSVFHCFGTTHFCSRCHDKPSEMQSMERDGKLPPCPSGPLGAALKLPIGAEHNKDGSGCGPGVCPLNIFHPPPGVEYCLGCSVCQEANTF